MAHLELFLVRHGETDLNQAGVYYGRTDAPLNPNGVAQADLLNKRLWEHHFDAIYASPAQRCLTTAERIRPMQVVRRSPGLQEMDFGAWEGKSMDWIRGSDPAAWTRWTEGGSAAMPPDGESAQMMHLRVIKEMESILNAHRDKGGKLLLVTHGGPLRAIAAWALGLAPDDGWHFACDPGSLSRIEILEDGYRVVRQWNA